MAYEEIKQSENPVSRGTDHLTPTHLLSTVGQLSTQNVSVFLSLQRRPRSVVRR